MSAYTILLISYLVLINVLSLYFYGIDKFRSKKKKWRIPEFSLLFAAFMGGAAGAYLAMMLFRHKTKHPKFRILVPVYLVGWTVLVCWLLLIVKI